MPQRAATTFKYSNPQQMSHCEFVKITDLERKLVELTSGASEMVPNTESQA